MKKTLLLLIFLSSLIQANETNIQKDNILNTSNTKKNFSNICKKKYTEFIEIERRGCCSWHGGVSGCSSGRVVCSDGTYSPSCTCNNSINPLG